MGRLRPLPAANFGIIGTGSDTGQSIRSPASATNLVGIRPTRGLVSRSGILPISTTQDEAGPMTRSVADAARMLDVMAAYAPDDSITAFGRRQKPRSYVASLDRDGLRGARIALVTDLMGTEAIHSSAMGCYPMGRGFLPSPSLAAFRGQRSAPRSAYR